MVRDVGVQFHAIFPPRGGKSLHKLAPNINNGTRTIMVCGLHQLPREVRAATLAQTSLQNRMLLTPITRTFGLPSAPIRPDAMPPVGLSIILRTPVAIR